MEDRTCRALLTIDDRSQICNFTVMMKNIVF